MKGYGGLAWFRWSARSIYKSEAAELLDELGDRMELPEICKADLGNGGCPGGEIRLFDRTPYR